MLRIGLPRALLYHKYAPLWTHFFQSLGCKTITSPNTNRQILENGIQSCVDETCLAVKIYLGHVHYLIGKVDYIFVPRVVSLYPRETLCVKFWALGDIIRNTFTDAPLLEYVVDEYRKKHEWLGMVKIGTQLTHNPFKAVRAYQDARRAQNNLHPQTLGEKKGLRVLLVAHAYVCHDALMGKMVTKILKDLNVEVIYPDHLPIEETRRLSKNLSKELYWTYNKELLGAIEYYRNDIDGIVFLLSFPCGPDSLVVNLCQNKITDIPSCMLVMDELQGDAGLKTRLESFIDILQFKRQEEAS